MARKNKNHHLEERDGMWFLRVMLEGARHFEALSTSILEARTIRDQRLKDIELYGGLTNITVETETKTDHISDGRLFGEVAVAWKERQENRIRKKQLKNSTWRDWKSTLNAKVLPAWGNNPIASIDIATVEDFIDCLECGPKRVNNILVPIRGIFKFAKRQGDLLENPMEDIDNLKVEPADIFPFSMEEVALLLQTVPVHYRYFFTVAFFTGMRFGEMAALKWHQVDFKRRLISVRETRVYGEEDRTKTAKSKRDIDMLPPVSEALIFQKQLVKKGKHVFRDQLGSLMTPDHIREVIWKPALIEAEISYRPPMQTRHTFATLMIDAGEDLGWVQRMMGHGTLQMIFTRYYSWVKKETRDDGSAFMKNTFTTEVNQAINGVGCETAI